MNLNLNSMVCNTIGIATLICLLHEGVWCGQWGNDPGERVLEDYSVNTLLVPDPDKPAPADGYIYQIRLYSIQEFVDFRLKILRATGVKRGEYTVVASSGSSGNELRTVTSQKSETILVTPAPLPVRSGDLLAFFFPSTVPIGYSLDNICPFGSRYKFLERVDPRVKQLITLAEDSRQQSCRVYSYVVDYVSGVGKCIAIYQGSEQSAGVLATPHYGSYFYENNLDLCWHITSDPGTTIIASLDYDLQYCCDFVEIFDGSTPQSPRLGKVSGRQINRQFSSTGRHMYIRARSDANISNFNGMIAHIYTRGGILRSSGSMLDTGTKVGLGIGFSVMIVIIIILVTVFCLKYAPKQHQRSQNTPHVDMEIKEPPAKNTDISSYKSSQPPPLHETKTRYFSSDGDHKHLSAFSDTNNLEYKNERDTYTSVV